MPKKSNSEAELRIRITQRKARIALQIKNEKQLADTKKRVDNATEVIAEQVAKRVKTDITNETILEFVIGEINRIVDGVEIDYNACREEKREDFRKYLKAQADVIYQQILKKTGRIHN